MRDPSDPDGTPLENCLSLGTVLIVDDMPASGATLEEACAAVPGVSVLAVRSALDAASILQDAARTICAVVTDIRMPRMDGFELIGWIRADPRHASTPIIVVTADTDPETPGRAIGLGANVVFSKPFSPGAVRRALGELLHETRNSR